MVFTVGKRAACAFNRGHFREGFHNFIEGATEKENFKNAAELMVGGKISFRSAWGGYLQVVLVPKFFERQQ